MDIPTWFPAASNDRFPPDSQIVLGSIITNPKQPENSLNNPLDLMPIPANLYIKTLPSLSHTSSTERNRDHTAGLQLKVAEFVDSELSHGWGRKNQRGIEAEKITSWNFRPDEGYVKECVAKQKVKEHLKREVGYFKKKAPALYMITGVKFATDAVLSKSQEATMSDTARVAANVGPVPVAVGPFGDRKAEDKYSESFRPEGEFVYAVRLRKFVFWRRMKEAGLESEYFTEGADIHGDEKREVVEEKDFEFDIAAEEEVGAGTFEDTRNVSILDGDEGTANFAIWNEEEEEDDE